jgi:hypothetical protein
MGRGVTDGLEHLFARRRPAASVAAGGALPANQALDAARLLARLPAPDNLVWQDDHLLLSSGSEILVVGDVREGECAPEPILRFDQPVSALAGGADGALAVGLGRSGVSIVGGPHDGARIGALDGRPLTCPTALAFDGPHHLLLCEGSAHNPPEAWRRDRLEGRSSGSVWRIDLARGGAACLGEDLAFPNGLLLLDGGARVAVTESWRNRLLAFETGRRAAPAILRDDLPGHPGRLAPAAGQGAWLAIFAPRGEIAHLPGGAAAVPRPVQAGAPARTCGLVVRLDARFRPVGSLQSGPDGRCNGVASCLEAQGELLVACRDGDVLVAAELAMDGQR